MVNKSKIDINFASSFYWFIECESQIDENCSDYKERQMANIFNLIKDYFKKEMKINPALVQNESYLDEDENKKQ